MSHTAATASTLLSVLLACAALSRPVVGKIAECGFVTDYVDVRVFLVTYQNPVSVLKVLTTLDKSDLREYSHEVIVKDNHCLHGQAATIDDLNSQLPSLSINVRVCCDFFRPARATGHLSRDWNYGLIAGFNDVDRPRSGLVVLAQSDTFFAPTWATTLHTAMDERSLLYATFGIGDQVQAFRPEAVKLVGLFDERFCNIGYQEADYMVRAVQALATRASINDVHHGRIFNGLPASTQDAVATSPLHIRNMDAHYKSIVYHNVSMSVFETKWKRMTAAYWNTTLGGDADVTRTLSVFPVGGMSLAPTMYPYFERR